jgi:hypothetical protein
MEMGWCDMRMLVCMFGAQTCYDQCSQNHALLLVVMNVSHAPRKQSNVLRLFL